MPSTLQLRTIPRPPRRRRRRRRFNGRCVYCGARTYGNAACQGHRDLIQIDPHYNPERTEGPS